MGTILGMDAAEQIRDAVARVARLRKQTQSEPDLLAAVQAVKRFQSDRFSQTYADILLVGPFVGATRFFLNELYSDKDYSQRDAQFARIAGALQRIFPKPVVATAVLLAELHVLTEELDHAMALAWQLKPPSIEIGEPIGESVLPSGSVSTTETIEDHYRQAWQRVGRESLRWKQLAQVIKVGQDLERLTGTPGLRLMLKMMRRPAHAAGLHDLQAFLESGFDTFAAMRHSGNGLAQQFLALIDSRETLLMRELFEEPNVNGQGLSPET